MSRFIDPRKYTVSNNKPKLPFKKLRVDNKIKNKRLFETLFFNLLTEVNSTVYEFMK